MSETIRHHSSQFHSDRLLSKIVEIIASGQHGLPPYLFTPELLEKLRLKCEQQQQQATLAGKSLKTRSPQTQQPKYTLSERE